MGDKDKDPWDAFTPEVFTDSVADKVFARMKAEADKDKPPEPPPSEEQPPAPTHKGARVLSWWTGEK